jgi:hypothetical protein
MSDTVVIIIVVIAAFGILVWSLRDRITQFSIGVTKRGITAAAKAAVPTQAARAPGSADIQAQNNLLLGLKNAIRAYINQGSVSDNRLIGNRNTIEVGKPSDKGRGGK